MFQAGSFVQEGVNFVSRGTFSLTVRRLGAVQTWELVLSRKNVPRGTFIAVTHRENAVLLDFDRSAAKYITPPGPRYECRSIPSPLGSGERYHAEAVFLAEPQENAS